MDEHKQWKHHGGASSTGLYFLGLIGAVVFYIQRADSFRDGAIGVLKALVWPAILVHAALDFLSK